MTLYIRCALANRWFLFGLAVVIGTQLYFSFHYSKIWWWMPLDLLLSAIGGGLIGFTQLGLGTRRAYLRTVRHYYRFKRIDSEFERRYENGAYCYKVGFRLARKDIRGGKLAC
ncbi:MAG: hypothetical protein JWO84_665 [Parcubacteria group bacterium]|nr:hypothetical protein [Parcubacteria group bacterium]